MIGGVRGSEDLRGRMLDTIRLPIGEPVTVNIASASVAALDVNYVTDIGQRNRIGQKWTCDRKTSKIAVEDF